MDSESPAASEGGGGSRPSPGEAFGWGLASLANPPSPSNTFDARVGGVSSGGDGGGSGGGLERFSPGVSGDAPLLSPTGGAVGVQAFPSSGEGGWGMMNCGGDGGSDPGVGRVGGWDGAGAAEGVLMSCMAVSCTSYDHRPSHPYNAGSEHVELSPTRQVFVCTKREAP